MRGLNIAREIRQLVPTAEIIFYTRNDSAEALCDQSFRYFIETDVQGLSHWPDVVRSFTPDVIIYDTILPKRRIERQFSPSVRHVYIMRKCKETKQQELFQDVFLNEMDLILIPHTSQEFTYEIPPALKPKSVFVGPIVRSPNQDIQNRLSAKYRIDEKDFLLTSTVGGGGFEEHAEAFFARVFTIHQRLYPILPNLRHIIIKGPNFGKPLTPLQGMTILTCEPEIVNLFAISDLIISEGGYNTVNEIRLAKTPAIFLPSRRNYDDQEERVRSFEERELAFVFTEQSPGHIIAQKVVEVISSASCLRAIRERYKADRMEMGNRKAAEKILELAFK